MVSKSERLLDLIAALLTTRLGLTAAQIRAQIEGYGGDDVDKASFQRSFERDKATLKEMGVPLVTQQAWGSDDANDVAYRIPPEEYYIRDPGLASDELTAVALLADTIRLDGVDPDSFLEKFGGAEAAGGGASAGPQADVPYNEHAATVFEAIARRRRLRFRYKGEERRVDPIHLHTSRGRWRLQGHDHARDDLRQFRLDRIEGELTVGDDGSATVVDVVARPTPHNRAWEFGDGEPVATRVLVDATQAASARHEIGDAFVVQTHDDGAVVFELPVRSVGGLRSLVLGFLDDAEILSPPAMRADLVDWLSALVGSASEGDV